MRIRFLRLFSLCVILTGARSSHAEDLKQALMLELTDGSCVAYYLETRPKVSFNGTDLVLSASDVEVSYPFDKVRKYTFEMADPSSVSSPSGDGSSVQVLAEGVRFSGLPAGSEVAVYTADGRKVSSLRADADGSCRVSLSTMPAGVYVISYGKCNLKMMKR